MANPPVALSRLLEITSFGLFLVYIIEKGSSHGLSTTSNHVIDKQKHNGANTGDHDAVEIQPGYANMTERVEQPSADDRTHDVPTVRQEQFLHDDDSQCGSR